MRQIYSLSILLYGLGIRIAALFLPKARKWMEGRGLLFRRLEESLKKSEGNWKGNVWFHCASLGEFEQGRPVIESFRELYPEYRIILTFFSPSGYEVRKSYTGADGIFYMPLDTPWNARKWLRILNPKLVFFIKYEYWFNFLTELNRKNIPVFIISAIFHQNQPFFKGYGGWFRKQLKNISWFFLQSEDAKIFAESLEIKHFTITGDTRFDRVWSIREQRKPFPLIEQFTGSARIFLGGSTWEPDEALILGLINQNHPGLKFIIAPHEVHGSRIEELKKSLQLAVG
ncbi:MAG: 3-deoxy-D-manno-octulosonic acid transferase, partial [Bacteroidia bacterium]|nr:3-deoxy-D-manno-octulosonic acid transferase [Bacteroidia bacterium]